MAATGFGFSIDNQATILGILIEVEGYGSGSQAARRGLSASPTKDGTTKAGNTGSQTDMTTTTPESGYKTWGTSSDLWGTTWTVTQINASTFGVLLQPAGTTGYSRFVDHVRVTVYYTPPIKAITDTGAGSDSAPNIKAGIALSDSGAGVDVATAQNMTAATPISVSDAGSGAEAYRKTMRMSETGAGVDAIAGKGLKMFDVGSGSESWRKGIRLGDTSTSGVDAIAVKVPAYVSDTGVGGGQTPSIKAAFKITDTGAGVDALRGKGIKTFDAGTGSDNLAELRKKLATLTDAGSGGDSLNVSAKAYLAVNDTGSGSEALRKGIRLAETGAGSGQTPAIKVSVPVVESGAGIDSLASVRVRASVTDAGAGSDVRSVRVIQPTIHDIGSGVDGVTAQQSSNNKQVQDSGSGSDSVRAIAPVLIHEAGVMIDSIPVLAMGTYLFEVRAKRHEAEEPSTRDLEFEVRAGRNQAEGPSTRDTSFDMGRRRNR
jgi:hypothetical protein